MDVGNNFYENITLKVKNKNAGLISITANLALSNKTEKQFCKELLEQLEVPGSASKMIQVLGNDICNDILKNIK